MRQAQSITPLPSPTIHSEGVRVLRTEPLSVCVVSANAINLSCSNKGYLGTSSSLSNHWIVRTLTETNISSLPQHWTLTGSCMSKTDRRRYQTDTKVPTLLFTPEPRTLMSNGMDLISRSTASLQPVIGHNPDFRFDVFPCEGLVWCSS